MLNEKVHHVYYRDFVTGEKHWARGVVKVKEQSWLGVSGVKVVYVIRHGGAIAITEWCLAPESRHILES